MRFGIRTSSTYRFIDSVPGSDVPLIVKSNVQSVTSVGLSVIAGAQDIVNVTPLDLTDSVVPITAVAVNVCCPAVTSVRGVKSTCQLPLASGTMLRFGIRTSSTYRFIDSVPRSDVP